MITECSGQTLRRISLALRSSLLAQAHRLSTAAYYSVAACKSLWSTRQALLQTEAAQATLSVNCSLKMDSCTTNADKSTTRLPTRSQVLSAIQDRARLSWMQRSDEL